MNAKHPKQPVVFNLRGACRVNESACVGGWKL
jgi:hypothetical protein